RRYPGRVPGSYADGIRLLRIDAVLLDRIGHRLALAFALVGERLQRGDRHEVAIYLEEVAQLGARVGAPEAVGAEHPIDAVLRHEGADLIGKSLDVVGRRDHGTRRTLLQAFGAVRHAWLRLGRQHVPAIHGQAAAA